MMLGGGGGWQIICRGFVDFTVVYNNYCRVSAALIWRSDLYFVIVKRKSIFKHKIMNAICYGKILIYFQIENLLLN